MAPGGIHLCPLQLLPGGKRLRGGERPLVLSALLRAVLRPLLCSLPEQDSGGESPKLRGAGSEIRNHYKNVELHLDRNSAKLTSCLSFGSRAACDERSEADLAHVLLRLRCLSAAHRKQHVSHGGWAAVL